MTFSDYFKTLRFFAFFALPCRIYDELRESRDENRALRAAHAVEREQMQATINSLLDRVMTKNGAQPIHEKPKEVKIEPSQPKTGLDVLDFRQRQIDQASALAAEAARQREMEDYRGIAQEIIAK